MDKSTIDNLKNIDVQISIKEAMDKRRDEIKRILFGYDPKTKLNAANPIVLSIVLIVFFLIHFLLTLYDTSNLIYAALKWTIMIGIYAAFVYYIHRMSFPAVNIFNVVYSLIPIIVMKILLWRWPAASSPIDNTLGVFYKYFGPLSRLLENVKYETLKGEPFDKISFPFDKIPMDWLINSFSKDDKLDDLLAEEPLVKLEAIKNIYIQTTVDSDGHDAYGYDDVIFDLNELSKWKRYIGHIAYDYIAFVLGLTYSMVLSVPS